MIYYLLIGKIQKRLKVKRLNKNVLFTPQLTARPNSKHNMMTYGVTCRNDSTKKHNHLMHAQTTFLIYRPPKVATFRGWPDLVEITLPNIMTRGSLSQCLSLESDICVDVILDAIIYDRKT